MVADGGVAFPLSSIEICEKDLATQSKTKVLAGWCVRVVQLSWAYWRKILDKILKR